MIRVCLSLIVSVTLCHVMSGQLQADPPEKGFVSLFDGKSLDGWEIMNGGMFSVENDVIKLDRGRGWLRSDKQYKDFVLKLELRFLKKNQDSGVFLRASKEGGNWPKKRYEVQCHNNKSMSRIFGAAHKRDEKKVAELLKETEEWNSYEITLVGNKLEVKLNGELVTTSDKISRDEPGYIGLQGEGGALEFRNIRIKELAK